MQKANLEMPILGLGTSQLKGEACVKAVATAIEIGYRHLDTAEFYGNHAEVGAGMRASGIPREQIFLTTKVPPSRLHRADVLAAAEEYLQELQTDYVDLLLIHWPNGSIPVAETLDAMKGLQERGVVRNVGVSNFTTRHLDEALAAGTTILANQVELHPTFNQYALQTYADERGITLVAYAPLGRGADLDNAVLREIARARDISVTQVILAWIFSRGAAAIPKASSREHLQENFDALSLRLTAEEKRRIDEMPQGRRLFNPSFAEFDD